ncbi:MAG: peptide chain release factor N(5)-glutamine methyltransferase [Leptospirales bacterium]|nr:peptide chain release factor N(5)-glutamine methyltransferase [Leptospirales bacterium]
MNVGECIKESAAIFADAGIENPLLDIEVIIGHFCGMERGQLKAYPEKEINAAQYAKIKNAVARRKEREPIAYITGEKEFYSLTFAVNPKVLIPRPETELLVDLAIYYVPMNGSALDLCTGCGAIAIALKCNRGDIKITATDISEAALALAKKNCRSILGRAKMDFRQGDLFAPVEGMKFDCIVSNPPYIDPAMKDKLPRDLLYEPAAALFTENSGKAIIEAIIANGKRYLKENGVIIIEMGESMGDFVKKSGAAAGFNVSVMNDYGGLPRVAVFKT